MNWVKPEFSEFLVPRKKRQRTDDVSSGEVDQGENSVSPQRHLTIANKLNLLSKYCPKRKEDLVVNKKKVEEVEYWLKNLEIESTYLILYGPPGSGKFRTISVLCKSLKIDCVEWVSPVSHSYEPNSLNNAFYQNDIQLFEEFVIRASRYSSILSLSSKRIIIVKDIPNGFCRDTSLFHNFLENYYKIERLHIVFIISDNGLSRSLFPEQIKMKFWVKSINFNPITSKSISTALTNLVRNLELQKLNPAITSHVDKISTDCNGDLRNALAMLHFILGEGNAKRNMLPIQKKKRAKGNKSKMNLPSDSISNTVPDCKIDIFHGLGRVLYAKRENKKLVHDPQEVADLFVTSPQLFVNMLHENYLNTFSSIHDVAKASVNIATSDLLLEDWNANSMLLGCGVSVASHGLMIVNSNPIRKFQQFNKPRSRFDTIIRECKDLLESSNPQWKGTDILMDIAPYAKRITYFNFPHKDLIKKLGSFQDM